MVVDDSSAAKSGDWQRSSAIGPYIGEGYLHDGGKGDGMAKARFTPKLPKPGKYEVRLCSTPPNPNRATNAASSPSATPSTATKRSGSTSGTGRPRTNVGIGRWAPLFAFAAGIRDGVEIRNDGADGHVIADAVQFVPVP